jgi:hypothetical protein
MYYKVLCFELITEHRTKQKNSTFITRDRQVIKNTTLTCKLEQINAYYNKYKISTPVDEEIARGIWETNMQALERIQKDLQR